MIYTRKHGEHPLLAGTNKSALIKESSGSFGFLFPQIEGVPHDSTTNERLAQLGEAMTNPDNSPQNRNSRLAPILTYFGQFIDHDITAGTDADPENTSIFDPEFTPLDRETAAKATVNMRTARLDLDSLYGDGVGGTAFDRKFTAALRSKFPGKMRIARPFPKMVDGELQIVSPPQPQSVNGDGANDILRLGELMPGTFTEAELRKGKDIPDDVRDLFFIKDKGPATDPINLHRAMIADARNDENLFVAQVHLAMLRLHNAMVDACDDPAVINGGSDALFEWARKRVRWIYQWMVVHKYLGALCDQTIWQKAMDEKAPLYRHFRAAMPKVTKRAPMPLEFSIAGFRFGHSMVRERYDWNVHFPDAEFVLLFNFTGSVHNPMFGTTQSRLPSDWPAEWKRLAAFDEAFPDRAARRIDTDLSFELAKLPPSASDPKPPEPPEPPKTPQGKWEARVKFNLASRNLLKGQINNLPSAQALIAAINAETDYSIAPLSRDQLTSGKTGTILADLGLADQTPLWFYILKEAEVAGDGNRLGALGSVIVADTLMGLIIDDDTSYWHRPGSDNGRWQPADTVRPGTGAGVVVDSLPNLLRAGQLL